MKQNRTGEDDISPLEEKIGYTFLNRELAGEALTHASRSNEIPESACNERLEFLGDAVLELIVSDYLFKKYPDMPEGKMTFTRAAVVSEQPLADIAREIGLPGMIRLGRGMENSGARQNPSVLSDAVEALIGALYIDAGIDAARAFILPRLEAGIETAVVNGFVADKKSKLQELLQKNGEITIEYVLDETMGAPHDRVFTVSVLANGRRLASGRGRSKKDAQQEAAGNALAAFLKDMDESGNKSIAPEKA
jgi:ribonuclease III